jgi:hypothetical protein
VEINNLKINANSTGINNVKINAKSAGINNAKINQKTYEYAKTRYLVSIYRVVRVNVPLTHLTLIDGRAAHDLACRIF